jgi:hypothetical protein
MTYFVHAVVVFVTEQRAFGAPRMPHEAQHRMTEQHRFGRQHAGDAVGAVQAERFAGHVGHAHAAPLGRLATALSITVSCSRLDASCSSAGLARPRRRMHCASSGRRSSRRRMRSTSRQPSLRSRPGMRSQRAFLPSSGSLPNTSISSSIRPRLSCQSAAKASIAMQIARGSPAPRSR